MSSDTERLEREAEAHRSSLDSTLDAIRDRLSMGQIVDEFTGYLKEGQGADAVKNLGRQVRDNPLALGLVGAGLTWLFLGSGARGGSEERRHEAPRPQGSGAPRSFSQPARTAPRPAASAGSPSQSGLRTSPSSAGTAHHSGTTDRLSHAADTAKGAASGAKDTMTSTAHAVSDSAGRMWDSTSAGMHDAAAAGSDAVHSATAGARQMGHDAYGAGVRVQRNIADLIEREPLVFGAVAFAIGAAAGAMLPATRSEDEWMGEMRDNVRDDVYAQGEDLVDSVKNVAAESYDAASRTAEEKGLKPGSGSSSETLAEKVSDVAKAATDTARDKAKEEGLR